MIVRINQLDTALAEQAGGWNANTIAGPIKHTWPAETLAYQVLILEYDEQHQPIGDAARREQIRQMLPQVLESLTMPDDQIVIRLDGEFSPTGIAPAFSFAADPQQCPRFSFSALDRLASRAEPPYASIRMFPAAEHLAELCLEPKIELHQNVRLRAFALPDELVDAMLDTADLDDERWRDLLPRTAFMVSTSRDLLSLLIWTARFDADDIRRRITDRLGGKERAIASASAERA